MKLFTELNIIEPILTALTKKGYTTPTPIQEKAIPVVLEGNDVFGCAQTGTGKTAAFSLPILQLLHTSQKPKNNKVRALILAPTRELAVQIDESIRDYAKNLRIRHCVVFGGVNQNPQVNALRNGMDIVVATPGRLLDLMNQGHVDLRSLEVLVLDEADRMLDMGFINDIRKIIKKIPEKRQTLMFSATIPVEIKELAEGLLKNPVYVESAPVSSTSEIIKQSLYYVEKNDKPALLRHLLKDSDIAHVLVFTRTKHGADKVAKGLTKDGIKAEAIHGNKSQSARQNALKGFKARTIKVLVATDIASRGIDVDKLSHVINYELPEVPETYVHRIGRTGRAGEAGIALSFCATDERQWLKQITRLIKKDIDVVKEHPYVSSGVPSENSGKPDRRKPFGARKSSASSFRSGNSSGSASRQRSKAREFQY